MLIVREIEYKDLHMLPENLARVKLDSASFNRRGQLWHCFALATYIPALFYLSTISGRCKSTCTDVTGQRRWQLEVSSRIVRQSRFIAAFMRNRLYSSEVTTVVFCREDASASSVLFYRRQSQ